MLCSSRKLSNVTTSYKEKVGNIPSEQNELAKQIFKVLKVLPDFFLLYIAKSDGKERN